jgi:PleD family two-component response regulator
MPQLAAVSGSAQNQRIEHQCHAGFATPLSEGLLVPEAVQKTIRILLVDDHALFREGVARLLRDETDFELVDSCASIDKAVEVLQSAVVDIVLLDYYFE